MLNLNSIWLDNIVAINHLGKKNANQSSNSTHPSAKLFLNNITANTLYHLQRYFTQRFLTLHTTLTTLAIKNKQTSR